MEKLLKTVLGLFKHLLEIPNKDELVLRIKSQREKLAEWRENIQTFYREKPKLHTNIDKWDMNM